jgi:hypothetical protein
MTSTRTAFLVSFFLVLLATQTPLHACTQSPGYGFWIGYEYKVYIDGVLRTDTGAPGTGLRAVFRSNPSGSPGSELNATAYTTTQTETQSLADFRGLATPAYWDIVVVTGPCSNPAIPDLVVNRLFQPSGTAVPTVCILSIQGSMSFSPNPYQLVCGTLLHANFSGTYGNPWVEVYYQDPNNSSEVLSGSGNVAINADGSIDLNGCNFFNDSTGRYSVIVYNADGQHPGYYTLADGADISVD